MDPLKYIKEKGIKNIIKVIYYYKLDSLFLKINKAIYRGNLKNVIIIESHNDFDCNGGAFYDYLIENKYNEKYKIVWLLKNKLDRKLPKNVYAFGIYKPSFKKNRFIATAKVLTADNFITKKAFENQKSFYFTHGGVSFKNVRGIIDLYDRVDYVLSASEYYDKFAIKNYSITEPEKRLIHLGFPYNDNLFNETENDLKKLTDKNYSKVILWMPTFRKGGGEGRNDSTEEQKVGIPLIDSVEEFEKLNEFFRKNNCFLVIKLHPLQDLEDLKVDSLSNIRILTGNDVKKLGIDNSRLMKCADAMISDYSSVAYQYLLLDRPIGFLLSDIKSYKLGFLEDDMEEYLVGSKIFNYNDFIHFISEIINGDDKYAEIRKELLKKIYKYKDGNASKRLAEFMEL